VLVDGGISAWLVGGPHRAVAQDPTPLCSPPVRMCGSIREYGFKIPVLARKTAWFYRFNFPGSTRENRQLIRAGRMEKILMQHSYNI